MDERFVMLRVHSAPRTEPPKSSERSPPQLLVAFGTARQSSSGRDRARTCHIVWLFYPSPGGFYRVAEREGDETVTATTIATITSVSIVFVKVQCVLSAGIVVSPREIDEDRLWKDRAHDHAGQRESRSATFRAFPTFLASARNVFRSARTLC